MTRIVEPVEPVWVPSARLKATTELALYTDWLGIRHGLEFESYDALWQWSTTEIEDFWSTIWEYFRIQAHNPPEQVLGARRMPGAEWFPGATLNFAEHALRGPGDRDAVVATDEDGSVSSLTYAELRLEVARVAAGLRALGVSKGDRVASLLPSGNEAIIACLATASIGAIWSSCSPDVGASIIAQRFGQIEPRVLIAVEWYRFGGIVRDRRDALAEVRRVLPSLSATVLVRSYSDAPRAGAVAWDDLGRGNEPALTFEAVSFDHPLWILYSSGTTGIPKAIVHSHGGVVLEQIKDHALHHDIKGDDRYMYFTTTGWAAWNLMISGLLLDSTVVSYEGSLRHPSLERLWERAASLGVTVFATSPGFLEGCAREGLDPSGAFDLKIRTLITAGAPLLPDTHRWLYKHISPDLFVANISGGTDMCAAVVGAAPTLPSYAGEMQCRLLGTKVAAYDDRGNEVIDQVGELVITEPIPSMPVFLWGDANNERYLQTWFSTYPGVWRHGDWIEISSRGTCVIRGRSDATLNRGGIRMGSTDFYSVVDELPEIADSLVVEAGASGSATKIVLFVVPAGDRELDDELADTIRQALRRQASPRHVPDEIVAVPRIPRTATGKKLEVPVKKILNGSAPEDVLDRDILEDPSAIDWFVELARRPRR